VNTRIGRLGLGGLLLVGAVQTALADEAPAPTLNQRPRRPVPAGRLSVGETILTVGAGFLQADAVLTDQSSQDQLSPSGGESLCNTSGFLFDVDTSSSKPAEGCFGRPWSWTPIPSRHGAGAGARELALGKAAAHVETGSLPLGPGSHPIRSPKSSGDGESGSFFFIERSPAFSPALFPGNFDCVVCARAGLPGASSWHKLRR